MHHVALALVLAVSCLAILPRAAAAQAPTGKALREIVTTLERDGYAPITEVSLDRGRWEIDAYKDGAAIELHVDPASGRVLARHPERGDRRPPANAKALSQILADLEAAGYTQIRGVSLERQGWEVEAIRNGAQRELRVDSVTGRVLSDRADD
jgi:uncharacterized membrane protein YkoI